MPHLPDEERRFELDQRTIEDFGTQWLRYSDADAYYASSELFQDILAPLLSAEEVRGKHVAEVGSGQGRIVQMLAAAGAERILALEPSSAFTVLKKNTAAIADRVRYLNAPGDRLPAKDFDLVVSIGVIHHIVDPQPVVKAVFRSLRPGGRFFMWVYGVEGNGLYLALVHPLRKLTARLPLTVVSASSYPLSWLLELYLLLSRVLPLPMRGYLRSVVAKLSPRHRRLVIVDQLHPAWAKYYRRDEAKRLLEEAGFVDIRLHHRHGYSWSAVGTKP